MALRIVGVVGGEVFGGRALGALADADLIVGAPRHLAALEAVTTSAGRIESLDGPLAPALDRLAGETGNVTLLASGDPGFFGIVRLARARGLDPIVHPAPSSVALAFGRLGLAWDDALVVSAHGRPLADAVARGLGHPKVAYLTSPDTTPELLGRALREAGADADSRVIVVSRLGEPLEAVVETDLGGLADGSFDPLSVVLVLADSPGGPILAWGLPESDFAHRAGMITKAEVRAVVLSKLALPSRGVLWDVGAGSGSVGIESRRLRPGLTVFAVERSAEDADRIRQNAVAHETTVEVIHGEAPEALVGLPDPDCVFVGGGGLEVLDVALARVRPGGRIVATYALIERAGPAWRALGEMVQLSVARAVPVGDLGPRLEAENPIFVCWGP